MASKKLQVIAFLGITMLYLLPKPYIHHSPNPLSRIYLTRSIVDHHRLSLDQEVKQFGSILDIATKNGHYYSDKAPGISLLGAPIYAIIRTVFNAQNISNKLLFHLLCFFLLAIPTLLVMWQFLQHTNYENIPIHLRLTIVLLYTLGTQSYTYSLNFFGHQLASILLFSAYLYIIQKQQTKYHLFTAGLMSGYAVITEYPSILIFIVFAVFVSIQAIRNKDMKTFLWFGAGALIPATLGSWYQTATFGAPWKLGYSYLASHTFSQLHTHGLYGIQWPSLRSLYGSFLAPSRGILYLSPWFLLLPVVIISWFIAERNIGRRTISSASYLSIMIVIIGTIIGTGFGNWYGGWAYGQRHLTIILPFLSILTMIIFNKFWHLPIIRYGVFITGTISIIQVAFGSALVPGYPEEFVNPFYQVTIPMIASGFSPSYQECNTFWIFFTSILGLIILLLLYCTVHQKQNRMHMGILIILLIIIGGYIHSQTAIFSTYNAQQYFRLHWFAQNYWTPRQQPSDVNKLLYIQAERYKRKDITSTNGNLKQCKYLARWYTLHKKPILAAHAHLCILRKRHLHKSNNNMDELTETSDNVSK